MHVHTHMLSFKPTFSLSSFTFIKRLFSSSSLSAVRVVSSAYLRLLTFLPAIFIPANPNPSLHGKYMGKQGKQWLTLFWGGSKITADGDCSNKIKRRLLLGRKVLTNLDSILKSRDIILPKRVLLVKATVFPVVMYGCESWTVKKAEHLRIDAFELRCWRRLLRVPWTARRCNQSILKEISLDVHWKD